MENLIRVSSEKLTQFINTLLISEKVDVEEAKIISQALVWSDLIGRSTHGVGRLPNYLRRYRHQLIKSPCQAEFQQKSETIYLVNGNDGFGHYLGHIAMEKATQIANQYGVGIVGVNHSNHFGANAYYVNLAAQHQQIGLAFSNSFPHVAPYGGISAVLGTNPFGFAVPTQNDRSIIVDFSTGMSAGSGLRKMSQNQEKIEEDIIIDVEGNSITDPQKVSEGVILPFGGAKGFCLGLMVEILSGVITGAGISHEIASMYKNFDRSANIGHFLMAIDITKLMPLDEYYQRIERLISFIKASKTQNNIEEILLPGEKRWRNYDEQIQNGIQLDSQTVAKLNNLAIQLGIPTIERVIT